MNTNGFVPPTPRVGMNSFTSNQVPPREPLRTMSVAG
jgi:hypothetical protein